MIKDIQSETVRRSQGQLGTTHAQPVWAYQVTGIVYLCPNIICLVCTNDMDVMFSFGNRFMLLCFGFLLWSIHMGCAKDLACITHFIRNLHILKFQHYVYERIQCQFKMP